ncbi:MAG: class I SAM-dependent methyltransferase, partial [Acidobacteriota bacterium]|nr:class I SAM-dependent methyltransferase [Acidobacteriota bacterium]
MSEYLLMQDESAHSYAAAGEQLAKRCPVCEHANFSPTEERFKLVDILRRWETEAGVSFSQDVWQEYRSSPIQEVTLYHCPECDFGMFLPATAGTRSFYKDITSEDGQCYSANKWEFRQAINDLIRYRCQSVLDVGSGSGYFLDLLREKLPDVEAAGYEFNEQMSELVSHKGHTVYLGKFPHAILNEQPGKVFDAVCIFQVLEHVPDPVNFLKQACSVLRPQGLLIVSVPNSVGPIRHFTSALTEIPPHHISRWSEPVFRSGLRRLGLSVLRAAEEPLPNYLWASYLP